MRRDDTVIDAAMGDKRLKIKMRGFLCLIALVSIIGICSILILNVGYDQTKGGFYWKPADISIKRR